MKQDKEFNAQLTVLYYKLTSINKIKIVSALIFFSNLGNAQNTMTSSPYSMYGIGEIISSDGNMWFSAFSEHGTGRRKSTYQ